MLVAYSKDKLSSQIIDHQNQDLLKDAIWIDFIIPSQEEEILVENHLDLNVPTRDEMQEIEVSSRLYRDEDALYMTAMMIAKADSFDYKYEPVTFMLTKNQLITIRYIEPRSFESFKKDLKNAATENPNALNLLLDLLENIIDRLADILEMLATNLTVYSTKIFKSSKDSKVNYRELLQNIGYNADLNSKVEESLLTFLRLSSFLKQAMEFNIKHKSQEARLETLIKDIKALDAETSFLADKTAFLLDATLGLIHIEQNAIIKIFSVAAVVFLPPTLIASIYGMNFRFIPELSWKYGYALAIGLMLLSSWLPYRYFKYRKWL